MLDTDNNSATGCTVTVVGNSVGGIEQRVQATVDSATRMVTEVSVATCNGAVFGSPTIVGGGIPIPVGLNIGVSGSDVVEFDIPGLPAGVITISVLASDGVGSDVLDGGSISFRVSAGGGEITPIPALSWIGLIILAGGFLLTGLVYRRLGKRWLLLSLIGLSGIGIAAGFMSDGQIGDWTGTPPSATDPSNDSTNHNPVIDMVAFFVAEENNRLFFRVDVTDIENQPPVFTSANTASVPENTTAVITVTAIDPEGSPVTYSLSGGADQAKFAIGANSGVLTFLAAPDFEAPADSDANNQYLVQVTATDGTNPATQMLTVTVTDVNEPPGVNQPPRVDAGQDQTIALPNNSVNLNGTVTDDGLPTNTLTISWSKVSGPGAVTFGAPTQATTTATFSAAGSYVLRLTANDSALTASDEVTITVTVIGGNQPPAVDAGQDITIALPNVATLTGTVSDDGLPINALAFSWSQVSGPTTAIFSNASNTATTAIFASPGVYIMRLSANDSQLTGSDDIIITVNADPVSPPPDPSTIAPPINPTIATTVFDSTKFLYEGPNAIQTGVAPGTINPVRAAVLKGRVLDKNNAPLSLVEITILNHPEFGQTLSRADGRFDMAVNGGGVLTVRYEKIGSLPLQRTDNVPWQDYCGIPDVVMMGYDPAVSFIDLSASTPIQVAQSNTNTDSSGTRRTALLFKQGTTALMTLPGGAMQGLTMLHVRATEFTVGTNGANAMPGDLPATSAYTYAVEYSLDEAVASNAVETTFSQPVIQYNENFLNFPVGVDIPSGAYDRVTGQWIASASGRVVKILSITGGTANLDVNGNGVPATDPEYAALGVNTAERQQLATLYAVNQVLWRVPIIHFSPWDSNWPYGPPPDAQPPKQPSPLPDTALRIFPICNAAQSFVPKRRCSAKPWASPAPPSA
ncbi:MAG: PKD domain-containing protein [Methylococcales bacterium]